MSHSKTKIQMFPVVLHYMNFTHIFIDFRIQ